MKFVISSSTLRKQIVNISGVIVNNPVVPVLEDFLFEVERNQLTITASDLQTSVIATLDIETEDKASIVVPSRILLDTLKNLPEQPITFTIDETTYNIEIHSNNGKYKLAGANAADFPRVAPLTEGLSVKIGSDTLKKAINQTLFATVNDELRPAMNGVFFKLSPEGTTLVATDGHKLVRYVKTDITAEKEQSIIIPRKTLVLLGNLLSQTKEEVTLIVDENNAYFNLGGTHVISRLIDERYPNYENVIPNENPHRLSIDRQELLQSLKRIDVYANKTSHQVRLEIAENSLQILAEDLDFSNEAQETLQCEYHGENFEIGFNARFLIEMLNHVDSDSIEIHFSTPYKAAMIFAKEKKEKEDLLLLIMPVILR